MADSANTSSETRVVADMDAGIPSVMLDGTETKNRKAPMITWENRKKMSWVALWALLIGTAVYTYLIVAVVNAPPDKVLDKLADVYFYFSMFMATIILGYFGFTSLPFIGKR